MYLKSFGLNENPFSLVSDPRFLFYSFGHCEAMANLLYSVRSRKGLTLLLGEAGTGKTSLVRAALGLLQSTRVVTSVIFNPMSDRPEDLLESILRGFELEGFERNSLHMAMALERFLQQQTMEGHIPVLIVDEAQHLSAAVLERLRLLSNLDDGNHKMIQIVLAAQPEMAQRLDTYEMRALRQRIVVRTRLCPLNPNETWQYLATRVARAGGDGRPIFSPTAAAAIQRHSGGIPRLINTLADNCLLAAYSQGKNLVDAQLVEEIAKYLELKVFETDTGKGARHHDVVGPSSSWKELVESLRHENVPETFRRFVDRWRVQEPAPESEAMMSKVFRESQ